MLKFERFEGPYGIPIFYQKMPEIIKCSALALANFVGSADDTSVGEPGLYHWFEHVPFRGTKKFPDVKAIKGPISRVGGSLNAWTSKYCTNYHATLPTRHLRLGLEVVFDLVAQPLLALDSILAEREVIKQEINDRLGSAGGLLGNILGMHLWPGHPLSFNTLGTAESLDAITPNMLHKARVKGYDRSRMAFFVATALPVNDVLDMTTDLFELLPSNNLPERRRAASFGPLPWESRMITIETTFSDSIVQVLFRLPPVSTLEDTIKFRILRSLFNQGGLGSPLYRAVREDQQLAYKASVTAYQSEDGGYWGFDVRTSRDKIARVEDALFNMMKDPQLRSPQWYEDLHSAALNNLEMEILSPSGHLNAAVNEVVGLGAPHADEEVIELASKVPHEQVVSWLDEIDFALAIVVVATGK